jgi:hypothetical protein
MVNVSLGIQVMDMILDLVYTSMGEHQDHIH